MFIQKADRFRAEQREETALQMKSLSRTKTRACSRGSVLKPSMHGALGSFSSIAKKQVNKNSKDKKRPGNKSKMDLGTSL